MQPGIFAKTFHRSSLREVLDAVQSYGLTEIQFNMSCAGLPSMPENIPESTAQMIGLELRQRGILMSAVSGTFNMIHPNPAIRKEGLRRLALLAGACHDMGTTVITLCTGTLNPGNMWTHHPGNASPEAWRMLTSTLEEALAITEEYQVVLAIEPELSNVVSSAPQARRLLDELKSSRLKIVMDAANLYRPEQKSNFPTILDEAFELLGSEIILAHAKDVLDEAATRFGAVGQGLLDFGYYFRLLRDSGYAGALVMHGLEEEEVGESLSFLRQQLM